MIYNRKALRSKKPAYWLWRGALLVLLTWVLTDLYIPTRHNIRQFDPGEVARLETEMWRSYYDKNPALLFWQLAGGLRQQFHAPFWRSFGLAFQATRAAFVFKQGQSTADYQRAMPVLVDYYRAIQELSSVPFNTRRVAALELNWWIIHRQRDRYTYADLADALARTSAALYSQPVASFATYARLRADAMKSCDEAGQLPNGATEADWNRIQTALTRAWSTLHTVVQEPRPLTAPIYSGLAVRSCCIAWRNCCRAVSTGKPKFWAASSGVQFLNRTASINALAGTEAGSDRGEPAGDWRGVVTTCPADVSRKIGVSVDLGFCLASSAVVRAIDISQMNKG